jgi:hypothetical protein
VPNAARRSGRACVVAVLGPGELPDLWTLDGQSGALLDMFFGYDPAFTSFIAANK